VLGVDPRDEAAVGADVHDAFALDRSAGKAAERDARAPHDVALDVDARENIVFSAEIQVCSVLRRADSGDVLERELVHLARERVPRELVAAIADEDAIPDN